MTSSSGSGTWPRAASRACSRGTRTGSSRWPSRPDGKTLASGSYDKLVKLWDVANGKEIATLEGHKAAVRAVAFAPDGATLASASADQTIKLWDIPDRRGANDPERAQGDGPRGRLLTRRQDARLGGRGQHGQALGARPPARSGRRSRGTPTWSAASPLVRAARRSPRGAGTRWSSSGTWPPARSGQPSGATPTPSARSPSTGGQQLATAGARQAAQALGRDQTSRSARGWS